MPFDFKCAQISFLVECALQFHTKYHSNLYQLCLYIQIHASKIIKYKQTQFGFIMLLCNTMNVCHLLGRNALYIGKFKV